MDAEFFSKHNIIDYSLLVGVIRNENSKQNVESKI